MYPIFITFVVFALFTYIYMRKSSTKSLTGAETILEREREANSVRRQPLTDVVFVDVNLSELPAINTSDNYILERLDTLKTLASPEVFVSNLSAYSNTDLKFKYGVANLPLLTEYDQNFTHLCRCLFEIGRRLYEAGDFENSKSYLEYGVKCGTDMKSHFSLLADIYEKEGDYDKISSLLDCAKSLDTALKSSLIRDLESRLDSVPS